MITVSTEVVIEGDRGVLLTLMAATNVLAAAMVAVEVAGGVKGEDEDRDTRLYHLGGLARGEWGGGGPCHRG